MRRDPPAAATDFIHPHERQRSPGLRERAGLDGGHQCARQSIQRPAPTPIVIRAWLLDVRHHDDSFGWSGAARDFGDERTIRPVVKGGINRHAHVDCATLQSRAHAIGGAPRRLESERFRGSVVGHASPLQHVLLLARHRGRIGRTNVIGDLGGDDSRGPPSLYRLLPKPSEWSVSQDHRTCDFLPSKVAGGAWTHIDQRSHQPPCRSRERVDGKRDAVALA